MVLKLGSTLLLGHLSHRRGIYPSHAGKPPTVTAQKIRDLRALAPTRIQNIRDRDSPARITLGDLDDAEAYVRQTIRRVLPRLEDQERDDAIAYGLLQVWETACACGPGESLPAAVARTLGSDMIGYWRTQHREHRRDTRGGEVTTLAAPTGLSDEHGAVSDQGRIESRLALSFIRGEADLRDARTIGRLLSVPSWGALPTGRAGDLWPEFEDERRFRLYVTLGTTSARRARATTTRPRPR